MKISKLHEKAKELGLNLGDTVSLLYVGGGSSQVVFRRTQYEDGRHQIFQFSAFDYVGLSGCTMSYAGSGRDGNFDFDIRNLVGVERWEPNSDEDLERVKLIREDLEKRTHKYIY